jgi:hypothetical protein
LMVRGSSPFGHIAAETPINTNSEDTCTQSNIVERREPVRTEGAVRSKEALVTLAQLYGVFVPVGVLRSQAISSEV